MGSITAVYDIFQIVRYIAKDKPNVVAEFLDEFEHTCTRLAEMPEMAEKVPEALRKSADFGRLSAVANETIPRLS